MTAQGESHSQSCFMLSVFLVLEGRVTNHIFLEIQKKVCEITYGVGVPGRDLSSISSEF